MKVRTQLEALARRGAGRAASLRVRAIAVSAVLSGLAAPPGAADAAGAHVVEEVVVTASVTETPRRQIGTAVSVISGPEIELRGYHSLADVLRTQPGIGVSNSGGRGHSTALRIRGEEAFRTVLYIDGVKAVDPTADKVAPAFDSLLATSDLERVEVLRGPQGFMYGADAGGVVNVLTRTGAGALGARFGVEYGSFDTRKLDASLFGGGDEGDYFVSVTDLETDGFNAQTADALLRDRDGAENTTLHAKLGWNATDALRVQLVARDIDAAVRFDGCGFPTTTHDCEATTEQTTYRLSADYRTDRMSHILAYSESDILRHSLAEGAIAFTADGNLSRFEYIGSFRPSDALTLAYGVDLQTEKVVGAPTRERDQKGYYFEYQGRLGEAFFVSAGARYDDNDDFGTHTSARLSAAYVQALGDGSTLKYRASYGTGFRPPSLYEIAYNRDFAFPPASNVVLKEETSRGYDVGLEYFGANGLRVELAYFDQDIEDEIFFDLVSFSGYLQSPGKSRSKGVEAGVEVPFGSRWALTGNWTYNKAEDSTNEQRLRRPRHVGNLGIGYTSTDERLRVLANYRVSRDSIDIGNVALDDYEVLDLAIAYAPTAKLEVYGRVENALDEDYQEVLGYNTAGRSAYGGVRLRF